MIGKYLNYPKNYCIKAKLIGDVPIFGDFFNVAYVKNKKLALTLAVKINKWRKPSLICVTIFIFKYEIFTSKIGNT